MKWSKPKCDAWSNNYTITAKKYIDSYNYMLPNFTVAKRRASWFVENGYGQND